MTRGRVIFGRVRPERPMSRRRGRKRIFFIQRGGRSQQSGSWRTRRRVPDLRDTSRIRKDKIERFLFRSFALTLHFCGVSGA